LFEAYCLQCNVLRSRVARKSARVRALTNLRAWCTSVGIIDKAPICSCYIHHITVYDCMPSWIDSIQAVELREAPRAPDQVGKLTETASLDTRPLYTIDARLSGVQCELTATPRAGALETLHFIVGCHCFGAMTQPGQTVFPHVASHQEGDRGTPDGVALQPNNAWRAGDRNAATRRVCLTADFQQMRENISCILLTISSRDYRRFGGLVIHLFQSFKDRSGVVTRGGDVLARRDLTFLADSGRSCGTFVIAALARHGGWWRLHAIAPWFMAAATPAEFLQQMCKPVRVCAV
jgi:hypothetical protein